MDDLAKMTPEDLEKPFDGALSEYGFEGHWPEVMRRVLRENAMTIHIESRILGLKSNLYLTPAQSVVLGVLEDILARAKEAEGREVKLSHVNILVAENCPKDQIGIAQMKDGKVASAAMIKNVGKPETGALTPDSK